MRTFLTALSLAPLLLVPFTGTAAEAETALVKADGWELVQAHCSGCHSLALVTAQRGDRLFWLGLIRWMQSTQNLWTFDEATERGIVDYLGTNYRPERTRGRRARLPSHLLPQPLR